MHPLAGRISSSNDCQPLVNDSIHWIYRLYGPQNNQQMHSLCLQCNEAEREVAIGLLIWGACFWAGAEEAAPVSARQATSGVFASSYIPLWAGVAAPGSEQAIRSLNSLQASGADPWGLLIAIQMSLPVHVPHRDDSCQTLSFADVIVMLCTTA